MQDWKTIKNKNKKRSFFLHYMDSPPRRSPGNNEFNGVARCCSPSNVGAPQRELALGFAHNWLPPLRAHVSVPLEVTGVNVVGAGAVTGVDPLIFTLHPAEPPCCCPPWPKHCSREWTSLSAGDSAKIVVFPRTQLFNAPWAYKKTKEGKLRFPKELLAKQYPKFKGWKARKSK